MIDRVSMRTDGCLQRLIAAVMWVQPSAKPWRKMVAFQHDFGDACPPLQGMQIGRVAQIARINLRRRSRICRLQHNAAVRLWPQNADMHRKTVAQMQVAHMLVDDADHEMDVQIRP